MSQEQLDQQEDHLQTVRELSACQSQIRKLEDEQASLKKSSSLQYEKQIALLQEELGRERQKNSNIDRDEMNDDARDLHNANPMEQSFEVQLSKQKNVALLTAKVQRLTTENANFQQELKVKQREFQELQSQHDVLKQQQQLERETRDNNSGGGGNNNKLRAASGDEDGCSVASGSSPDTAAGSSVVTSSSPSPGHGSNSQSGPTLPT